ncbi:MAG TPA: hypothetical protein VJU18_04435 [Vicinamibacteria bacterium]|nr:hypothetical protein [Vicinamibacteria bacterium]
MPSDSKPKKACCMISEILEEAGIDREKARQVRRQLLEGLILLCQWQLERMDASRTPHSGKKARKVAVE